MSIQITVHGKPVTVQRERGFLRDLESVKRLENERRKKERIVQVREQSKEIASRIRKRVNDEKERQEQQIEKIKREELSKWKRNKLDENQRNYQKHLTKILDANEEAKREIEQDFLRRQRKKELDLIAAERGRNAVKKVQSSKKTPLKKKAKSISVQTEEIPSANSGKMVFPGKNRQFRSSRNEMENNADPISGFTLDAADRNDAVPRCCLHDKPKETDNVISARSVDFLERSKKFVESAHQRLNDIENRTEILKSRAFDPDSIPLKPPPSPPPPPSQFIPITPIKLPKSPQTRSPLKSVHENRAAKLRTKPKPAAEVKVAKPKVVIPKKTIPSMLQKEIENDRNKANSSESKSPQKVTYYDHPNRFTKQYDVPKNVVIKMKQNSNEEDAVTNALKESHLMEEEELAKEERLKELKRREMIRELEQQEKSQVRRDYEMLAKQLEEIRRMDSKADNTNRSILNSSQSFTHGILVRQQKEKENQRKMNEEFVKIAHQPVLITCPEVGRKVNGLNVALDHQSSELRTSSIDFSASDSCKSIILENRKKDFEIKDKEVVDEKHLALNMLDKLMREIEKQKNQLQQEISLKNQKISKTKRQSIHIETKSESDRIKLTSSITPDSGTESLSDKPLKIVIQVEDSAKGREVSNKRTISDYLLIPKPDADGSTISTCYQSPPSEIETDLRKFITKEKKEAPKAKKNLAPRNPQLRTYINKLLGMSRAEMDNLEVSEVSEVQLTESIIAMKSNQIDEQKLKSVDKMIEENYTFLKDIEESIHKRPAVKKKSKPIKQKPVEVKEKWNESLKKQIPRKMAETLTNVEETQLLTTRSSTSNSDHVMKQYTHMAYQYNKRISVLTDMISKIREEKEKLMAENSLTISDQAIDSSTKYKDFPQVSSLHEVNRGASSSSDLSKLSDLKSNSNELEEISEKLSNLKSNGKTNNKPALKNNLESNKLIGLSRDSGISMSRPVTSNDLRDNSPVIVSETKKEFEPMLKDIPKAPRNQDILIDIPDLSKRKPPPSITRFSPEFVHDDGHELSTIAEVDTPVTSKLNVTTTKHNKSDSIAVEELRKFPTFEEFSKENPIQKDPTISMVSDVVEIEKIAIKKFPSHQEFVGDESHKKYDMTALEFTKNTENDLDLSLVMNELKRRNLLSNNPKACESESEINKTLSDSSKELDDLLNIVGLSVTKFVSHKEFVEQNNVTGLITSGELNITKSSICQKEGVNITEYEVDSEDDKLTSKNDKNEVMGIPKSPKKIAFSSRVGQSSPRKKANGKRSISQTESSSGVSGVATMKKSDNSSSTKDMINMTDDLINELENNLNKIGLTWAASMLKKGQTRDQLSTSSTSPSLTSTEEATQSEVMNNHNEKLTDTMSLMSDNGTSDTSAISGKFKHGNLQDFILNELKRKNKSNVNSSDTSLESNLTNKFLKSILNSKEDLFNRTSENSSLSERNEGGIKTSTPVPSNSNSKTYNSSEKSKHSSLDSSQGLFSGESKLSSVRGSIKNVPTKDNKTKQGLDLQVPDLHLDLGRYKSNSSPDDLVTSTASTQYNFNENNKRKPVKRSSVDRNDNE